MYNNEIVDSITIAQIGQEAENSYFGKPYGLMDQMVCSVGGLNYIDFENSEDFPVEKIEVNFDSFEHSLCIIDTKVSYVDLIDDYAEILADMRKVAALFDVDVLRQTKEENLYKELSLIRKYARGCIHWFDENACGILETEIGKVFVKVLEDADVYKCTETGRDAFMRFIDRL